MNVTSNGSPKCSVISTYSPTEAADKETVKEFQSELSICVKVSEMMRTSVGTFKLEQIPMAAF